MIYVSEDYLNYKYLVSYSDNFVILSNRSSVNADWNTPKTIDCVIQYFEPSIVSIPIEQTFTSTRTFTRVDVTSDFYARADCNQVINSQFLFILFWVFLVNAMSRFFKKGGIFFGS